MAQFIDFFALHYPAIIPAFADALVSFFVVRFYLNISNQIVSLGEKMDERFVKADARFLELTKNMNERFAKADERFVNLIKKICFMPQRS